jgi:hypothetical protein
MSSRTLKFFCWLRSDHRKASSSFRMDKSSPQQGFGKRQRSRKHLSNHKPIESQRRVSGGDAVLELIDQAARAVHDAEERANAEKYARSIAEMAVKTLQRAVRRIQELEAELESSRTKSPSEVHTRIPDQIVRSGMMTLVAHAREKVIALTTYLQPRIKADATIPGISDHGLPNVGWSEILARADAALNEASARAPAQPRYHKNHLVSQQAA